MPAVGLALALAAVATVPSTVPVSKHEVKSLPGWKGALPSRVFTGFLDGGVPPSGKGKMYFHYMMVESENDPANDPVLVWYNGGPGASSLFGLLLEFGPLTLNVNSYDDDYNKTGVPSPQRNPFSWSKFATLIAIDSPPPVGFSYCTEQGIAANGTSCGPWTDKSVFKANHVAHRTLFTKVIPEFMKNDVYFVGESYAGIYVPGFVEAMMDDPIEGLNFKGFMVGDGWWGCEPVKGKAPNYCVGLDNVGLFKYPNVHQGPWYDMEYFHGHSQFSESLYRSMRANCSESDLRKGTLSAQCQAYVDRMSDEIGGWYPYDVYNDCAGNGFSKKYGMFQALNTRRSHMRAVSGSPYGPAGHAGAGATCPGEAMPEWLGLDVVQTALGVPEGSNFVNCDNAACFNYTGDQTIVTPIYERALKAGLRVLVYEGDSDACGLQTAPTEDIFVPFLDGLYKQKRGWRPWTTDGAVRMGGYTIEWDADVQFVSFRGAGHMVPLNKPEISGFMIESWLRDQTLPDYTPPSRR